MNNTVSPVMPAFSSTYGDLPGFLTVLIGKLMTSNSETGDQEVLLAPAGGPYPA